MGWPTSASQQHWWEAQARQQLVSLQLHRNSAGAQQHQPVCCLTVQQHQDGSACDLASGLAAVGYSSGILQICHLPDLHTAAEAAVRAAGTCWQSPAEGTSAPPAQQPAPAAPAGREAPAVLSQQWQLVPLGPLTRRTGCCTAAGRPRGWGRAGPGRRHWRSRTHYIRAPGGAGPPTCTGVPAVHGISDGRSRAAAVDGTINAVGVLSSPVPVIHGGVLLPWCCQAELLSR